MKVGIVVPSTSRTGGGVSEVARVTCLALREAAQEEVQLQVHSLLNAHSEEDLPKWSPIDIEISKTIGPRRYGFTPSLLLSLLRAKPDIVHVHGLWMYQCLAVYIWHVLTGRPYIVTPHGMLEEWITRRHPALKRFIQFVYQRRMIESAAFVQCLSSHEVSNVINSGHSGKNCTVIPNFVPEAAKNDIPPPWYKGEFADKTVYLFLGRIHPKKGWRELCNAWALACNESASFANSSALAFCGWKDASDDFDSRLNDLARVHGNAFYFGPQFDEDKARSFLHSSVFLLPSFSEGLPMTVLEAWSHGVPAIITPQCNLNDPELQSCCVMTNPDAASIKESLLTFHALKPDERSAMGQRAKEMIAKKFSRHTVINSLLDIYRQARGSTAQVRQP